MKRIISAIIILTVAVNAFSQTEPVRYEWKNDLAIAAGPISCTPFLTWIIEMVVAIGNSGYKSQNSYIYGTYSLNYHYQALPWLRAGAKVVYEGAGNDYYNYDKETDTMGDIYSHHSSHWVDFMASLQFTYYNRGLWKLYSGLDLGIACYMLNDKYYSGDKAGQHELKITPLPAFDLTVFGLTVGKQVYGLAELNIGMDAIAKVGIGARF